MLEVIIDILRPENVWCLFPIFFIINYELILWFIAIVIAFLNTEAVYDKRHRRILLELARTSIVWKRVIKILGIKEN